MTHRGYELDFPQNRTRSRVRAGLLVAFVALAGTTWLLMLKGHTFGKVAGGTTVLEFLLIVFSVAALYELVALAVGMGIRLQGGSIGEVQMLTSFIRVILVLAIAVAVLHTTGYLRQLSAVVGAFAGLLLGWSLQAPVSGMAAWAMVTLKRPFRVGDRVLLPTLGLNGDVLEIGLMYTKLNQVGGSIGSEEAIGRDILIPNAMLFSQVVINYTPQQEMAYFLDEVVIRLTYDSDWDTAEKILLGAAREVTGEIIRRTGKEPYVRSDNYDYGVYMRLRYMTLATDRPRMTHEILKRVFKAFQGNPRVDFAIPYVYSGRKGMEGAGRAGAGPEPIVEVEMAGIDDPEADAPLRPADPHYIDELADRIRQMGLLQPILVQRTGDGRYRLMAGRFRFLACQKLGWRHIPAVIRESEQLPRTPDPGATV